MSSSSPGEGGEGPPPWRWMRTHDVRTATGPVVGVSVGGAVVGIGIGGAGVGGARGGGDVVVPQVRPAKQPVKETMLIVPGMEGWVEGGVLLLGDIRREEEEEEGGGGGAEWGGRG